MYTASNEQAAEDLIQCHSFYIDPYLARSHRNVCHPRTQAIGKDAALCAIQTIEEFHSLPWQYRRGSVCAVEYRLPVEANNPRQVCLLFELFHAFVELHIVSFTDGDAVHFCQWHDHHRVFGTEHKGCVVSQNAVNFVSVEQVHNTRVAEHKYLLILGIQIGSKDKAEHIKYNSISFHYLI